MKTFAIMREPGQSARARHLRYAPWGAPRPRRMATVDAPNQRLALEAYVNDRYLDTGNRQYRGHHLEWANARTLTGRWYADDGKETSGRDWRMSVILENGAVRHEVLLRAWTTDR